MSSEKTSQDSAQGPGDLFVLSAPSGAGKSTLIREMMAAEMVGSGEIQFSVSHTTREPRKGEVDGEHYHFVPHERFEEMIAGESFLEWAQVHNHYYGTAYNEVLPRLRAGTDVILDIDVQGAERVIHQYPDAHTIFIVPPNYAALEKRLAARGLDDEAEISRRLAVSLWEVRRYGNYKYVIINDDLNRASRALASIIQEKRLGLGRMKHSIEPVIADFERASERRGMSAASAKGKDKTDGN